MDRTQGFGEGAEELARRIREGGDSEAEARLVERYARGVRLVLDRHTRDSAVAEDLCQETFLLAIGKLRSGEVRDASKLTHYLASVARNLAIEHYRKVGRRQTEADSPALEEALTARPGPFADLEREEEAELVRLVLDELPVGRDREILYRFYLAEEDRESIAGDHGLTTAQLNRLLYRARQRYKDLYLERLRELGRARV
ncbi:MAG: sigma-70 family RNA polymerase sigma factor, partial [Holophagales bacterium]|nr:sigma-70 family RNA polymerase sigma factor [Holophagales bacterium]